MSEAREKLSQLIDDKRQALRNLENKLLDEMVKYKSNGTEELLKHKTRLSEDLAYLLHELFIYERGSGEEIKVLPEAFKEKGYTK